MSDRVAIGGKEDMEDEVTATNNETTVFVERSTCSPSCSIMMMIQQPLQWIG